MVMMSWLDAPASGTSGQLAVVTVEVELSVRMATAGAPVEREQRVGGLCQSVIGRTLDTEQFTAVAARHHRCTHRTYAQS